jgi:hydroxymethylpyrimidine/phosphomethylpyrimidine kinase
MPTPIALSIAGSDPSGGAGIQADLKTFHAHGVYGEAVITLLTAQNSLGVSRVEPVAAELIDAQLGALLTDMAPHAVKLGALPSAAAVRSIANRCRGQSFPLVVDPILRPTRGAPFSEDDMVRAYLEELAPLAALFMPNAVEAAALSGVDVSDEASAQRAAERLLSHGPAAVLVKGGHLAGDPVDVLVMRGGATRLYRASRVQTAHTHGTGCTYSAAITALLARGVLLEDAIADARSWLSRVMAAPLGIGQGRGPLNHFIPPTAR